MWFHQFHKYNVTYILSNTVVEINMCHDFEVNYKEIHLLNCNIML